MRPLLLLLLCATIAQGALAAPLAMRDGATRTLGQGPHAMTLTLSIVGDTSAGPAAIFVVDGVATRPLHAFDETILPGGAHLMVKDILQNRRSGMATYYLWIPKRNA